MCFTTAVELISDHHLDHGSIAGFIIQACANDHPVGQFVSSDTDTGWQPAHCLQTNVRHFVVCSVDDSDVAITE